MNPLGKVALGADKDRELLKSAWEYTYHQSPQGDLKLYLFAPPEHNPEASVPLIVFFHGGRWDTSMPTQFAPHAMHFARRGFVTCLVEYRVATKHQAGPIDATADAQTAIQFIMQNAQAFGVNPDNIILAGGAGGGHLALNLLLQQSTSTPTPAALILFGPLSDTTPKGQCSDLFGDPKTATSYSPSKLLPQKNLPPCLIIHGKDDRLIPVSQSIKLAKLYKKKRNHCEFIEYQDADHNFYNFNTNERLFKLSLNITDGFLVNLGLLEPDDLLD